MPAATRTSWKNTPLSATRTAIPYVRTFDAAEHARVIEGLVPKRVDDKWFVFYEAPWLYLHRSWTGICIYAVKLRPESGAGSVVEEALANRDPEQYRTTDDAHDARLVSFLIDRLLLGRDIPFPVRETFDVARAGTLEQHVLGRVRNKA